LDFLLQLASLLGDVHVMRPPTGLSFRQSRVEAAGEVQLVPTVLQSQRQKEAVGVEA